MKSFTKVLNTVTLAALGMLFFLMATAHSVVDLGDGYHAEKVPTAIDQMFISGECWNGGEGHPIPSRLALHNEVIKMDGVLFDKALRGEVKNLRGFCK